MSRVLGLDIGGSQSSAQLSVGGSIVAEGLAGSASLVAVGPASAAAALADLIAQLRLDPALRLDVVCVGSAGASLPATREFLSGYLAPLTRSGTVLIVSDADLILPAAGLREGIAVICGTGSAAVGGYQGDEVQAGGWGYLLGDEGSGYWIVRAAIRTLLDRRDRRVPLGALGQRLISATGTRDLAGLSKLFYDQPFPRNWARHAPLVLDSADEAATRITAEAAGALAGLAVSAAERLAAPAHLPIVLGGGLLRHAVLEAAVRAAISRSRPGSNVRTLAVPPVTGAVRLAQAAEPAAGNPAARNNGYSAPSRPRRLPEITDTTRR